MTIAEAIALIQNDRFPVQPIVHWADLGCGSGLFTRALSTFLPAGSVAYGVDRSTVLKKQTTTGGVDIVPVKADFITDSLPFGRLDGIIMANALHYVNDKPAFLQKLQAHLKDDALIVLVEYDTDTPVPTWVPYPVSFASLQKLAKTTGYTSVERLGEHPSVFGNGTIYSAMLSGRIYDVPAGAR